MNVTIKELAAYIKEHNLERVAVDVVDVNVPNIDNKYNKQKPRILAKRLIILSTDQYGNNPYRIHYAMYNSFKRSNCILPNDFSFVILHGDESQAVFDEYDAHIQGLEKSFREAYDLVHLDIQTKVAEAAKLLKEAEELSNNSGVPFRPQKSIGGFAVSYMPASFKEKFGDDEIIQDLAADLTGAYGGREYEGWQQSQTC